MKTILIRMIRFYQKYLSPKKPPCCKYVPTCSSYAIEAIEKRGAFVGFFLSLYRILRCNPFSKGGYDPVPEKGQKIGKPGPYKKQTDCPDAIAGYLARHPQASSSAESQDGTAPDTERASADEKNRI